MTPAPDTAPGWSTVQQFIERVAAHSRQDAFPVTRFDGGLAGIVVSDRLARIRPADRATTRVDQVAVAVPPEYLAAPGDAADALLTRPPLAGQVAAVVLEQGRVVGLVTTADLSQAMQRGRLRGGHWPERQAEPAGTAR
jgi:CBS-domain-containing membrane protein